MKYLIFISLFLIQFVFGEEDPSFEEELNDIPEGKITVQYVSQKIEFGTKRRKF